jgi:hypothetical protein
MQFTSLFIEIKGPMDNTSCGNLDHCAICGGDDPPATRCTCQSGIMCDDCFVLYIENFGTTCSTCRTHFKGKIPATQKRPFFSSSQANRGNLAEHIFVILLLPTLVVFYSLALGIFISQDNPIRYFFTIEFLGKIQYIDLYIPLLSLVMIIFSAEWIVNAIHARSTIVRFGYLVIAGASYLFAHFIVLILVVVIDRRPPNQELIELFLNKTM